MSSTPQILLRYLGQVGVWLRLGELTVVIDPYLSYSVDQLGGFPSGYWVRNYPPPISPDKLTGVDLILCTHDHLDHTDPETLRGVLSASPGCRIAAPKRTIQDLLKIGFPEEKLTVLNEKQGLTLGDVKIEPVAASHESYEVDADGFHRFLGYLLHWRGMTIYHAGDTIVTPELKATLRPHAIDIGFLPINGRSDERRKLDVIGNMDAPEAFALAAELAAGRGFRLLVPTHYDLYDHNGAQLSTLATAWQAGHDGPRPGLKAFLPGEELVYQSGSGNL